MNTYVPTQDAPRAMHCTEIQGLIAAEIKRIIHGMNANESLSPIDETLDHALQFATMSAEGEICTLMYCSSIDAISSIFIFHLEVWGARRQRCK